MTNSEELVTQYSPTLVLVEEISDKFTAGVSELPLHPTEVPLNGIPDLR